MKQLEYARSAARWAGVSLGDAQLTQLEAYAEWLIAEAIPAGGMGPREADRLWQRHIGDSLVFLCGLPQNGTVVDIGTGVGLPGIPLAIARPDLQFWLLDRGGRRTRLVERSLAILELGDPDRMVVMRRDVHDLSGSFDGLVFRGALRPVDIPAVAARLLSATGVVTVGLSRQPEPPPLGDVMIAAQNAHFDVELVGVPEEVLDGPAWLLKMARSGT